MKRNMGRKECVGLIRVIDLYNLGSGKLINFGKSTIYFSRNIFGDIRDYFGQQMRVRKLRTSGNIWGFHHLLDGVRELCLIL